MRKTRSVLLAIVVAALAVPSTAFAVSGDQTDPSGGVGGTGSADGGTLPFTGLNLAIIVLIAVGLMTIGLVLRRRARSETPETF